MHCALRAQIWRISCYTKLLIVVTGFSKDLVLVPTALVIRLKMKCHPFERLRLRTVPCIFTAALIHIKTKLVYEKPDKSVDKQEETTALDQGWQSRPLTESV